MIGSDFLIGILFGVAAMSPLCVYLWRCNAPLQADARVGRARLAALAKARAKRVVK